MRKFLRLLVTAIVFSVFSFGAFAEGNEVKKEDNSAAPFGLTWGASNDQIKKLGVELTSLDTQKGSGTVYGAKNLPKVIEDAEIVVLGFGFNDKLYRIVAISKDFSDDPYGAALRMRYDALSKILAEKYGSGKAAHHQGDLYSNADEFLMSLKTGRGWHYTDFQKEDTRIQLSVDAKSSSTGFWKLIFMNKPLEEQYEKDKKQQEKGAL